MDDDDADADDDVEGEETKRETGEGQSNVAPKWQSVIQEKRRITLERVNGCGDALVAKSKVVDEVGQIENEHEEEDAEGEEEGEMKSNSANRMDKKKNVTTLFSRLGIRGTKQQKQQQRPVIVTPWRSEPSDDNPASSSSTVALATSSSLTASPPSREKNNPLQMWPSIASLHCIGWAKVTSSYTPQKSGELALLEGDLFACLMTLKWLWRFEGVPLYDARLRRLLSTPYLMSRYDV
ncbi:unnamed protein product [Hydatigera taeniaeformis]|uniref:CAF1C_H4-bd domain-containing protein n=1 Tax=Hydatigena taeniaeformis TaxID=6205 RepID=A0A0R3WVD8_HYDTA|nr:unnamed protein product [Hydatigera taeniaeformis]